MKVFTIALAFALLFSASAKLISGSGFLGSQPVLLDGKDPLQVRYADFQTYFFSAGSDPIDTLIFYVTTPISSTKQTVVFDVSPMRKVIQNLPISISGCDSNGINCYPDIGPPGIHRMFDQNQLKENDTASIDISRFTAAGSNFYLYLQVQREPGCDNPPRDPGSSEYGLVNYEKQEDTAFTLTLQLQPEIINS